MKFDQLRRKYELSYKVVMYLVNNNIAKYAVINNIIYISKCDFLEKDKENNFVLKENVKDLKNKINYIEKNEKKIIDINLYYCIEDLVRLFALSRNRIRALTKANSFDYITLKNSKYYRKESIELYINRNNLLHYIKNTEKYIEIKNINSKYNIRTGDIKKLIKMNEIRYAQILDIYFIYRPDLEFNLKKMQQVICGNKYINIREIVDQYNVSEGWVFSKIRTKQIKDILKIKGRNYINKDEIELLVDELVVTKNIQWYIDSKIITPCKNKNLSKTLDIVMNYINYKKHNGNCEDKRLIFIIKKIGILIELINEEIFNIKNKEILFYYKTNVFGATGNKEINKVLKFIYRLKQEECKFDANISFNYAKKNKVIEIYEKELWHKYYKYSTSMERHIEKSLKSSVYSEVWLYVLFHFSNAWRAKDIVHLPLIDAEKIIKDLHMREKFYITKDEAINLFKIISMIMNETKTSKTKQKLILIMPEELLIPTMTAYAICSIHANNKKNSSKYVFYHFRTGRYPSKIDFESFLSEVDSIPYMSNRKANKTLITLSEEYNSTLNTEVILSSGIGKVIRSHKSPNTTGIFF